MTRPDHPALTHLRRDPELAAIAAGTFGFDLDRAGHLEGVRLASGAPLTAVAGDDTGGTFFTCADGSVLYASSDGRAGLVAGSPDEALEILIGRPAAGRPAPAAVLLRQEAGQGPSEELRIAAVLVALHGQPEDHAELRSLRESDPDFHFLLNGFPGSATALAPWAAELDDSDYGPDPHDAYDLTWTALARRQGRTEAARAALVRLLDDTEPRDGHLLAALANEFTALGDLGQAIRARHLHASLQDDPGRRGEALRGQEKGCASGRQTVPGGGSAPSVK
ncbi:hypothetical protein ACIPW5_05405 [Streptomyces sp. NPDC090077]|uniref:hypothetical protein n=1 Tax=Streptomyces sp. NPDC090077 TaxID=3365938 RepID=UPI003805A7D0